MRAATPDDVSAVVALVQAAYRGEESRLGWTTEADLLDGPRTDTAAVTALLQGPGSTVLVLEQADGLVGCCHVELRSPAALVDAAGPGGPRIAYLGMIAVRPRHQGRGAGRAILAAAETYARRVLGASRMEMTVIAQRTELVAWYERRGWSRTGERRPFPHGDPRVGVARRGDLEFVVLSRECD